MTDILPLLLDKKPVPEYLLGFWCIAMQNNIPVLDTQFFLQTILCIDASARLQCGVRI